MPEGHYNVLFLSNRNMVRSIFAEALTNRLGGTRFTGFSAGMKPADQVDPLVLDILRVGQYPIDTLRPKIWEEFAGPEAPPLDFVFTLCDPIAGEPLPHWPGRPITADWRYPDPRNLHGEQWERRRALGQILAGLERQFRAFMQLPFKSLDEISLRERLSALGRGSEPETVGQASLRPQVRRSRRARRFRPWSGTLPIEDRAARTLDLHGRRD